MTDPTSLYLASLSDEPLEPGLRPFTELKELLKNDTWLACDTEFYGYREGMWDPEYSILEFSPAGRVRPFLVCVGNGEYRGIITSPADFVELVSTRLLVLHNAPVDYHALQAWGVTPTKFVDTLNLARFLLPGREKYSLDSLGADLFKLQKTLSFSDVFEPTVTHQELRTLTPKEVTECSCGTDKCRKRTQEHVKTKKLIENKKWVERKTQIKLTPDQIMWEIPNRMCNYVSQDVRLTALLFTYLLSLQNKTRATAWPAYVRPRNIIKSQAELSKTLCRMEAAGIGLDLPYFERQAAVAHVDLEDVLVALDRFGPRETWASWQQLQALFTARQMSPSPIWRLGLVKAGEVKTDRVALQWMYRNHTGDDKELIRLVLELRRITSSVKYLDKLPRYVRDGLIHPVVGPASDSDDRVGAKTGRLAMKNPEGQQIPRDPSKDRYAIRKGFVPLPGEKMIVCDSSQLEVVSLAHICKALFNDDQLCIAVDPTRNGGVDFHAENARRVFGVFLGERHPDGTELSSIPAGSWKKEAYLAHKRDLIKTIWYGLQYGKGGYGFGNTLLDQHGEPIGREQGDLLVKGIYEAVPVIPRYQRWVLNYILKYREIPSLFGRISPLEEALRGVPSPRGSVNSLEDIPKKFRQQVGKAYRHALNFPNQASGADIIGDAMVAIDNDPLFLETGYRICLQVHDEIIARGPDLVDNTDRAMARMVYHMCNPPNGGLLSTLGSSSGKGDNWYDAK